MSGVRTHVVVAGGGVAGIETALALHELVGHRIRVTMLSPEKQFLYRPVTVGEAFERSEARAYSLSELLGDQVQVLPGALASVDVDARDAVTDTADIVPYDFLVVAAGARPRAPFSGALTFRGRPDVEALRELVEDLVSGRAGSVAFAVPSEPTWALPLYELALMTAGHLYESSSSAKVHLVTPEDEPLALFGPAASEALGELLKARGIALRTSSRPVGVDGRALMLAGGGRVFADRVVTLPELMGPALPGLPADEQGFLPVDAFGRVSGVDRVYAAGDVTAFPLKQGGLAAQQADAVAESIACRLGASVTPRPFTPVLRGLLMTGGAPLYLRSEPQRLPRSTSVAVEAAREHRRSGPRWREVSAAAGQPLWWPPAKIAGRYLAPRLATARPQPLAAAPLIDRVAVGSHEEDDEREALELALLLADCDARWGDYASALSALEAAEALEGALPPEYEAKRREWTAALRGAAER